MSSGTGTSSSETSSKTPSGGLLTKLRNSKGLAAGAIFGALLVSCVVLIAALLIYLLLSNGDKGHAIASPTSVTPDDPGSENATTNGTTELAPAAYAAWHNVAARTRRRNLLISSRNCTCRSFSEGSPAGNAARRRGSVVSTNANTGIGRHPNVTIETSTHPDAARTNRKGSSAKKEIALMEAALIDGEVFSDTFTLPDAVTNESSIGDFINDSAVLTSTRARREEYAVLGVEQETPPDFEMPEHSDESTDEVADTQTSVQQEVNLAENKQLHHAYATDITVSFGASTGTLANDIEDDNFVMSRAKGPRNLHANSTTNSSYDQFL
ncbi:hypothetical protein MRX96_041423 [Rhipicephalus microplus]